MGWSPSSHLIQNGKNSLKPTATIIQSAGWQGAPSPTPDKKGEAWNCLQAPGVSCSLGNHWYISLTWFSLQSNLLFNAFSNCVTTLLQNKSKNKYLLICLSVPLAICWRIRFQCCPQAHLPYSTSDILCLEQPLDWTGLLIMALFLLFLLECSPLPVCLLINPSLLIF